MTRRINAAGLSHIQKWEGKRLTAYQDVAGIWTIGYGHTSAAGASKVVVGMKISEQEAVRILRADLAKFEKRVREKGGVLVMAVDPSANPAHRFNELPDETQEFLSQLREDDIETLKDGLRLVIAMRTVGRLMKWMIVAVVGTFIGTVMLYENILKVLNWINQSK